MSDGTQVPFLPQGASGINLNNDVAALESTILKKVTPKLYTFFLCYISQHIYKVKIIESKKI